MSFICKICKKKIKEKITLFLVTLEGKETGLDEDTVTIIFNKFICDKCCV